MQWRLRGVLRVMCGWLAGCVGGGGGGGLTFECTSSHPTCPACPRPPLHTHFCVRPCLPHPGRRSCAWRRIAACPSACPIAAAMGRARRRWGHPAVQTAPSTCEALACRRQRCSLRPSTVSTLDRGRASNWQRDTKSSARDMKPNTPSTTCVIFHQLPATKTACHEDCLPLQFSSSQYVAVSIFS